MEKLVQRVQEKTEQVEQLKKENGQLFLNLTEQVESWKKIIFLGIHKKYVYVAILYCTSGYRWLWEGSQRKPSEVRYFTVFP